MKKLLTTTLLILTVTSISIYATKITQNPTQTKQCDKCGKDGKGGGKCAPGKCGKGK